jgi:hypothetical protein
VAAGMARQAASAEISSTQLKHEISGFRVIRSPLSNQVRA